MDRLYRSLLSPESLHEKRRKAQVKTFENAIAESLIDGQRQCASVSALSVVPTSIESNGAEINGLVKDILSKDRPSPLILGIDRSKLESDVDDDGKEIYLHLAIPSATEFDDSADGTDERSLDRILLVPLSSFAEKLATGFKQQLTSTALCFVADASGAIGTHVIGEIVNTCNAGLALVKEPGWMASLAYLIEQKLLSKVKIANIIFALCRLEAWRVRRHIGKSHTVVFTLPGQSSTAPLLPHLQKTFPCERHVFIYDGCVDSTARASRLYYTTTASDTNTAADQPLTPPSLPRYITATTPISLLTSVRDYPTHLSCLNYYRAAAVEAWMTSVDAFLALKENERESSYLPFVCRIGFLFADTGRLGNGTVDQSRLALTNLLQYITGSRSRTLEDAIVEAANHTLTRCRKEDKDSAPTHGTEVAEAERVAIEACVFAHKSILIGDKTLLDTVQPKEEWSLKAAKKLTSCLCCAPQEDEDEEDEGYSSKDGFETGSSAGNGIIPHMARSKYVDGKTTFAFDPSRFTGM